MTAKHKRMDSRPFDDSHLCSVGCGSMKQSTSSFTVSGLERLRFIKSTPIVMSNQSKKSTIEEIAMQQMSNSTEDEDGGVYELGFKHATRN